MTYFVIGDEETITGFRLAGIPGRTAGTPFEAREALTVAASTEGINIILITERLASSIPDVLQKYDVMSFPLIITIPDRKGPIKGRQSIRDTVKAAVGVKI